MGTAGTVAAAVQEETARPWRFLESAPGYSGMTSARYTLEMVETVEAAEIQVSRTTADQEGTEETEAIPELSSTTDPPACT
jgi:hypothetical protein